VGPVSVGAIGVDIVVADVLFATTCAVLEDRIARDVGGAGGCATAGTGEIAAWDVVEFSFRPEE
jgi:hypothetical protein